MKTKEDAQAFAREHDIYDIANVYTSTAMDRLNSLIADFANEAVEEYKVKASRKHVYWGAGEPDCPRDIKAGNGELHTLRCKVCGLDRPKSFCEGEPVPVVTPCGKICATRAEYEEGRCTLSAGHVGRCYDASAF